MVHMEYMQPKTIKLKNNVKISQIFEYLGIFLLSLHYENKL